MNPHDGQEAMLEESEATAEAIADSVMDALTQALRDEDMGRAGALLHGLHPAEAATLLESLPSRERQRAWQCIEPERQGEVLAHTQEAVRAGLLERLEPQRVAEVTRNLDDDDAVDILRDISQEQVDSVLRELDAPRRVRLGTMLHFPEDVAGGLMNTDVISIRADVSLEAVKRYLRYLGRLPEGTDSLMVVDARQRYLGVLPLVTLLTSSRETVGENIRETKAVPADMPANEVASLFARHDLLSAPVIDEDGILLGRITIDDVVDLIRSEANHTVRQMAGLAEEDDLFAPAPASARSRAVWLGINLATAFLASWVIGRFQESIEQLVALAVLMPIVASMGGVAGGQTLTVAIRGLALGQLGKANAGSLLLKELAVGCINGALWATVVAGIAILWFGEWGIGAIFGSAIFINLVIAALVGATLPFILKRHRIDPAVAGNVVLTTVTDVVGFMTFLGLGTLLLL